MDKKYCEHNRKGILIHSLYGRFRVYTCAINKRQGRKLLAGWSEPCVAQCINRHSGFLYKLIDKEQIPFNEEALKQQKDEKIEKHNKAEDMRRKALSLIKEADELEKD